MIFYPLTDKKHKEIVAEIAERRLTRGSAAPMDPSLSTAAFIVNRAQSTPTE
ncbi:Na+/melibiose symporter-like transporter [Okibacterium sp. HSC-33S16]|uniref:hypothetical protein n=1 Tax=Okibacterium sp. HSC-33S16 TaxID=2910965 RepID=UPI00209D8A91|nr:hypothetical protein [Okibacterium sp. HSC-33S16]MCP2030270.1 Na+/melibiose symporter-like transporter [Okibacterium sp. HSC-33S16]